MKQNTMDNSQFKNIIFNKIEEKLRLTELELRNIQKEQITAVIQKEKCKAVADTLKWLCEELGKIDGGNI